MWKMCDMCGEMQELVRSNSINLELIQKLVDDGKIEFYAGNCYPEELDKYIERGNHYTINTYYHCKKCDKYYYVGFSLYGNPLIEEVDKKEIRSDVLRLEWGYVGTYYKNGAIMDDAEYVIKHQMDIIEPAWVSLMDAFGYGTATPMQALIKTLKMLYARIQRGETFRLYYPAEAEMQLIDNLTFDEIIKKYFDEFVLKEIKINEY